jgi:hypothetical protein
MRELSQDIRRFIIVSCRIQVTDVKLISSMGGFLREQLMHTMTGKLNSEQSQSRRSLRGDSRYDQ